MLYNVSVLAFNYQILYKLLFLYKLFYQILYKFLKTSVVKISFQVNLTYLRFCMLQFKAQLFINFIFSFNSFLTLTISSLSE